MPPGTFDRNPGGRFATQRANFAIPGQSLIGLDGYDRTVKYGNRFSIGPLVIPLVQRQVDLVDADGVDFHAKIVTQAALMPRAACTNALRTPHP